jgi:23S rRNA pseudouridine2605 synthase
MERGKDRKKKPVRRQKTGGREKTSAKDSITSEDGPIRLNRFISNAGVCSRREADQLIQEGRIKVNGKVVKEMGMKVTLEDRVSHDGKPLNPETYRYVLLNKPKGYITTTEDPLERKTVMDLVAKACRERIVPVGRLERETLGLLLLTNDGEIVKKLTSQATKVKKIYHVFLDKKLEEDDMDKMRAGIVLDDGKFKVDVVNYVVEQPNETEVGVQTHSNKNQIIKRAFEHFGYKVVKMDRVLMGGLTKKDLPRGKWRHLTEREIGALKMLK